MTRLLIIDDHPGDDCYLGNVLSANGYRVYVTGEKEDGIEIAKRYRIELILCNLSHFQSGECTVRELQRCDTTVTIPLVYISATPNLKIIRRMMSLGADDFLIAPVDIPELICAIDKRIQKREALKDKLNQMIQTSFDGKNDTSSLIDHFIVTIGNRLKFVKFSSVICITAQKEYSLVRTRDTKGIIVRRSLKTWMDFLPAHRFLQIHRSTIINIEAIQKIKKVKPKLSDSAARWF